MKNDSGQGPISFSSLNVENLIAKLNEPDFVGYIRSFDIFCSLETFTGSQCDTFKIIVFSTPLPKKLLRQGR